MQSDTKAGQRPDGALDRSQFIAASFSSREWEEKLAAARLARAKVLAAKDDVASSPYETRPAEPAERPDRPLRALASSSGGLRLGRIRRRLPHIRWSWALPLGFAIGVAAGAVAMGALQSDGFTATGQASSGGAMGGMAATAGGGPAFDPVKLPNPNFAPTLSVITVEAAAKTAAANAAPAVVEPATSPVAAPGTAAGAKTVAIVVDADEVTARPIDQAPPPRSVSRPAGVGGGAADAAETSIATDEPSLSPRQKRDVQRRLTALGFDTQGVDGVFGRNTRTAVAAWQAKNGMAATGYMSASAVNLLNRQSGPVVARTSARPAAKSAADRSGRGDGCRRDRNGKIITQVSVMCDFAALREVLAR